MKGSKEAGLQDKEHLCRYLAGKGLRERGPRQRKRAVQRPWGRVKLHAAETVWRPASVAGAGERV